jgi:ATP phosphoribosyltransferase regulatory subunit
MNTSKDWLDGACDAQRLAQLEKQAGILQKVFDGYGYEMVEPPVIQPADVFLELSGEAIRQQMFVFADMTGNELCLRPEFTIPVCRLYLQRMGSQPAPLKLSYHGKAFRAQDGKNETAWEFFQAGVESIGDPRREAAECEVLALAVDAVREAGLARFEITVGSLALIWTFFDKLSLPQRWRARLRRHFSKPERFASMLEGLSHGLSDSTGEKRAILNRLSCLPEDTRFSVVETMLEEENLTVMGGRSVADVTERLQEQIADLQEAALPASTVRRIEDFLAVKGPLEPALVSLSSHAKVAGADIDAEIEMFRRSLEKLSLPGDVSLHFAADLGRGMDYYTAFVFELRARDGISSRSLISGGRYDRLLQDLGAPMSLPAVGCAIRTEQLLLAVKDAAS